MCNVKLSEANGRRTESVNRAYTITMAVTHNCYRSIESSARDCDTWVYALSTQSVCFTQLDITQNLKRLNQIFWSNHQIEGAVNRIVQLSN